MMRPLVLAAALILSAASVGAPSASWAGQEQAAHEAPAGGQAPLARVLKELGQRYKGKQLNTTMGEAAGKPVYLVQWQLPNGRITVFTVDAHTGQVLSQ
ncbi:PepSY domain-containing protein [Phenylobacterium sp.]|uniref:PepSY domain-containing protein n=1 Tax=Phenylobacterium sp. TaxID=1871053 RepID=UPI00122AFD5E|nr:PepSY domain-containing protein [Phenylobacterium sp.]THD59112.1 MAG: hypothetical protein E8A49_17060 [Phenylobacterium sp.]